MEHRFTSTQQILRSSLSSVRAAIYWFRMRALLVIVNRFGNEPITRPDGPVVSLTTYGPRMSTVFLVIESIARGCILPSRLILWIDDDDSNLPVQVRRLMRRGLEVRFCKNYGPHKKYYPYLEANQSFCTPLVTADDDVLYPRDWLERLVAAYRERPDVVNCYRARVIEIRENQIGRYSDWKFCTSQEPRFRHFATGVSGIIYPPKLLTALKEAGTGFEDLCPWSDDFWLHFQSLRAGFKVRQFVPSSVDFLSLPGTQECALAHENVLAPDARNDHYVKATYNEADIRLMSGSSRPEEAGTAPLVAGCDSRCYA
jgi:hypothetical protein